MQLRDVRRCVPCAYTTPGGFCIGDDVHVTFADGHVERGRVQGADGPFVRVMLASGHGYLAAESAVKEDPDA